MRDYGKVHSSFWSSETIRSLSEDGRMLALYLMTSPHTTITGTFRLPDGYACEDLGWSAERVVKGFAELFANGFANRCETTKWVWICKHLEWNPPENPNQRKSAAKMVLSIPAGCTWKAAFLSHFGPLIGLEAVNPSETLAEPFRNQEQEQEQEQKKDQEIPPADAVDLSAAKKKASKAVTLATWIAALGDEDAIPGDDPIYAYADSINLPSEFIALAWGWFKQAMEGKKKTDWRAHFRNAVKGNWPKYWWPTDDGGWRLSPAGEQAKRAAEAGVA